MKKILTTTCLIVIALALTFMLTACSGEQQTTGKTFIGGTEGLKQTYLAGNPPATVVDNGQQSFAIVVKLENLGEDDIKANEGYIQIAGLEPSNYNTASFKKAFPTDIAGAKMNYDGSVLNGGTTTVEFGDLKYLSSTQGDMEQNVYADVCYKYTTKMSTQLCIKKDAAQSIEDDKICALEGEKNPQNSGAPIQITSLKESFSGSGKIALIMTLTHSGNGDAFFKDTDAVCNDVITNGNKDKVHIKFGSVTLAGKTTYPQCTGLSDSASGSEGYLKMYKDASGKETATLYCTLDVSSTTTISEVPLQAEVTYLYLQHIETPINIRHVAK